MQKRIEMLYRYRKRSRSNYENRARWIVEDSRKVDRKLGLCNDLDKKFVDDLIRAGCSYCGGEFSKVKMTLDRINNAVGHIKTNVIPSCVSCNKLRSNLPYEAWLLIAPAVRKAKELGLLKEWGEK